MPSSWASIPRDTPAVPPTIVTEVTPRSRTSARVAPDSDPAAPSTVSSGSRCAAAAAPATRPSVHTRPVASQAWVALPAGKAWRTSARAVSYRVEPLRRRTTGAYFVACRATVLEMDAVEPTTTMAFGASRFSSAATVDGMPWAEVSSTPPFSATAAGVALSDSHGEVPDTR